MSLQRAKSIEKVLTGFGRVAGFVIGAPVTSSIITASLTTALTTAGNGGTAVPLQVSSATGNAIGLEQFTPGVITTGGNRVPLYDTFGLKLDDNLGNEVYGRITEAAGVYTLSYFSSIGGVQTAYTMPASTIDYTFGYRFTFAQFPSDAIIRIQETFIGDDPATSNGRKVMEVTPVTALNTIGGGLAFPPVANSVQLIVQGHSEDQLAGGAFTVAGSAITWSAVSAGYNLDTVDRVVAIYQTLA